MSDYAKYIEAIRKLGAAEYHVGILLECLKKHFDPETRDYTAIIAIEHAERFLDEIKTPTFEETLSNLSKSVEAA